MKRFADTFYFLALLNPRDNAHASALAHTSGPSGIVTTEFVLLEVGDALSSVARRPAFVNLHDLLRSDRAVEIVSATADLFARAFQLFESRRDKEWSLTDCASFVVMRDQQVTEALTGDRHFEQAGFRVLLK